MSEEQVSNGHSLGINRS